MTQRIIFEDEEPGPLAGAELISNEARRETPDVNYTEADHQQALDAHEQLTGRKVLLKDYPLFRLFPRYGAPATPELKAERDRVRQAVEFANHPWRKP